MKFTIDIDIKGPDQKIRYPDQLLMVGSCFTEHIGKSLEQLKFPVLQNPNGILFDPLSVAMSLMSYTKHRKYSSEDLFYHNELWHSWHHHSRFSGIDADEVLNKLNESHESAHNFLKNANWLIITLGSAFAYQLTDKKLFVANCHKAPAQQFIKHLCTIEEINAALDNCLYQLIRYNPRLQVILTVSPVRHIRDGVINNNRSKARLLEAVHHLSEKFDRVHYFPAYELVIDVLRDYRFYDIDLVHPNYQATRYVLEQFLKHFLTEDSQVIAEEVTKIVTARKHKPFHETSEAHGRFRQLYYEKTAALSRQYPFLSLKEELDFFSNHQ